MAVRNRSKFSTSPLQGTAIRTLSSGADGTPITATVTERFDSIVDNVEPGNGHPLTIEHYYLKDPGKFPRATGQYSWTARTSKFSNFPIGRGNIVDPQWNMAHAPIDGAVPSVAQAAAKVAADTNPSRPHVDIPVALLELLNLKTLFIKRTNDIGRDIASGRLALEYGYKPLIGDLIRLTELGKAFDSRVRELKHLRRTGLRRKRTAWKGTGVKTLLNQNLTNQYGLTVVGDLHYVTTAECVVFIRWGYHPLLDLPGVNDGGTIHEQAAASIVGWTPTIIDGSTLWEVMGFSWYFDWWSNAGDFIAASRNSTGAFPEKIQVMYHTKTEQQVTWRKGIDIGFDLVSWNNRDPVYRYHETKTRSPTSLSLEAHLPILSERQITILADIMRGFK